MINAQFDLKPIVKAYHSSITEQYVRSSLYGTFGGMDWKCGSAAAWV